MFVKIVIIYTFIKMIYPIDYCSLSCGGNTENIACKCPIGSECGSGYKLLLPDEETKDYIVKVHNDAREKVASGSTNVPGAGNMVALAYADDLQYTATCWAKQCVFQHDKCRRTENFQTAGQNLFASTGQCDGKSTFKQVVDAWYSEIQQASADCITSYNGCSGHFTQVVWAKTTHVGCSRMLANKKCLIACNYGPAGNMISAPVYDQNPGECEKESGYTHLCKAAKAIVSQSASPAADTPTSGGSDASGASGNSSTSAANIKLQLHQLMPVLPVITFLNIR